MFRSNYGRTISTMMGSGSSIDSSTTMLDWNEQAQIGGTLWADLMVSEDHIVPYPIESEDYTLFPYGDYSTNKKDEAVTADVGSTQQSSIADNKDISYNSESISSFHTGEELSSSRTEMDPWSLDFPNLCIELRDDNPAGNSHGSVTGLMNDLSGASYLNSWKGDSMQLDCGPELFGLDDEQNGDILDCGWDAFGDFDDIENLFPRNDTPFGHDMIGSDDEFLSSSKDVINSAAQSIPLPDLPLCNDQTSNKGCSSVQLDGHSEKQRSPLRNEKVDGQKIMRGSQNKAEERRMNRPNYNNAQLMPSTNIHSVVANPLQTFQSPDFQINGNQKRPVSSSYEVCLGDAKHKKTSNRVLDAKPTIMTPQEKMEKLRRVQKVQAQLAIEQQHQQFTGTDEYAERVSSSDLNMLIEEDESKGTSSLPYHFPLEETIYYQLQEEVEKLDMKSRLCIRDSLLRLARSAMERQSASDRNNTNKNSKDEDEVPANEELRDCEKSTSLADSETDTNPIDRVVASLLFQRCTSLDRG